MTNKLRIVICAVVFNTHQVNAQDIECQQIAEQVFSTCVKKNMIYPKGVYDKSFFDDVSLRPIPLCAIKGDSLTIIHGKCPYLIIISKNEQYVGVVSSDDVGNSYIDIDFVYGYNGTIKNVWNLMQTLSNQNIILYNVCKIDDQIVFIRLQNKIMYMDFNFFGVVDDALLVIDHFKPYSTDSIPNCGLLPRNAKKNSKKNLHYYTIGYD